MINVIVEIAGQQLKFVATKFNIENNDVFLTLAEGYNIKQTITPPSTK